jgi:formamidopyrimidine-DNA glycosylase
MPELPDLEYIVDHLREELVGKTIVRVRVKNPLVLRVATGEAVEKSLIGQGVTAVFRHGHFIQFELDALRLVMHLMLTGRLQIAAGADKPLAYLCCSFFFEDDRVLHYGDQKQMGKIYVLKEAAESAVPGYAGLGPDILSSDFSPEYFKGKIRSKRTQARVFLMDKTIINSVGNAYADEILFAAKIHPKTPCRALSAPEIDAFYESIRQVMQWGIAEVKKAGQPIEVKVRDHMKVRFRQRRPCPVCGTPIRRVAVYGHDAFFCPRCQPSRIKGGLPW